MGTHSFVGVRVEGVFKGVYVHWDGYPSYVGNILTENYNTLQKVEALIELGEISVLAPKIEPERGENHSFERPAPGVTIAYNRDRGEVLRPPVTYETPDEIFEASLGYDWAYCFNEGKWFVASYTHRRFVELNEDIIGSDCLDGY